MQYNLQNRYAQNIYQNPAAADSDFLPQVILLKLLELNSNCEKSFRLKSGETIVSKLVGKAFI